MNRQQFSAFVKNPGLADSQSLKALEELVKRYPCCQSGQILYTYNLFKENDLQYPLQLKKAAAYSGDRKKLKELFFQPHPDLSIRSIVYPPQEAESSEPEQSPQTTPSEDRLTREALLDIVRKRLMEIETDYHPPKEREKEGLTKNKLIEKFIIEEPRISPPKTSFFNPSESASQSNVDEEEIISETLARLYANQGNIQKAIHIYEKLSLLNQEKSRYFAAQIENLKS